MEGTFAWAAFPQEEERGNMGQLRVDVLEELGWFQGKNYKGTGKTLSLLRPGAHVL